MILSHKNCIFNEFNDWVIEQLDHIMVEDNLFYSGYSTIRSRNQIHKEYPDFEKYILNLCDDKDLFIKECWINVNPKNGYQSVHDHSECDVAGTYYVCVPENSGVLKFYNPAPAVETLHRLKPYVEFTSTKVPNNGDIVFWHGYMKHEVTPNMSDDLRVSISFMMDIPETVRWSRFSR